MDSQGDKKGYELDGFLIKKQHMHKILMSIDTMK